MTMNISANIYSCITRPQDDDPYYVDVEGASQLPLGKSSDCNCSLATDETETLSLCETETLSLCESECSSTTILKDAGPRKRRVSLNTKVEVREYAVTIGDHPMCFDGLPLTLDWEHAEEPTYRDLESSRERSQKFKMPKRLSYDDRRSRLRLVSDSSDDEVRNDEIDMVINMLQDSWSRSNLLPMPEIEEIESEEELEQELASTEEEEEDKDEEEPKEMVIEWRRNPIFKRSTSFSE